MSHCIMLIRHAEKPTGTERGVNEAGALDADSLSVQGWRRAGALGLYFTAHVERRHQQLLCRPQHILAARPTAAHPSSRPFDTVEGLADRLGVMVDQRWSDQDSPEALARHLRSLDAPVLVCWRHDQLAALGKAIGAADAVPDRWPDDRFDVTWAFHGRDGRWAFEQVPQLLLAGDRLAPIGAPAGALSRARRGVREAGAGWTRSTLRFDAGLGSKG